MRSARQRFEAKFRVTPGCWEWTAGFFTNGYGQFWFREKVISAHVASHIIYLGEIPDGLWVLHRCDNRKCVNPDHFFLGTRIDNIEDMLAKGRNQMGEAHYQAKLTKEDVLAIRNDSRPIRQIAAEYGVHHTSIGAIKNGKSWRSV